MAENFQLIEDLESRKALSSQPALTPKNSQIRSGPVYWQEKAGIKRHLRLTIRFFLIAILVFWFNLLPEYRKIRDLSGESRWLS
jgi:hypothetical protein